MPHVALLSCMEAVAQSGSGVTSLFISNVTPSERRLRPACECGRRGRRRFDLHVARNHGVCELPSCFGVVPRPQGRTEARWGFLQRAWFVRQPPWISVASLALLLSTDAGARGGPIARLLALGARPRRASGGRLPRRSLVVRSEHLAGSPPRPLVAGPRVGRGARCACKRRECGRELRDDARLMYGRGLRAPPRGHDPRGARCPATGRTVRSRPPGFAMSHHRLTRTAGSPHPRRP